MNNDSFQTRCAAVLLAAFAVVPGVFGQANPQAAHFIVTLDQAAPPGQVAAAHGLGPRHVYSRLLNGFAAPIPPGRLAALAADSRVTGIFADHEVFALWFPRGMTPPWRSPKWFQPAFLK